MLQQITDSRSTIASPDASSASMAPHATGQRDKGVQSACNSCSRDIDDEQNAWPLTSFPVLTGLRPKERVPEINSFVFRTATNFGDLQNITSSLGVNPITALQAAWAVILTIYTAVQDNVVFLTAFDLAACHEADRKVEDAVVATSAGIAQGSAKGVPDSKGISLKQFAVARAFPHPLSRRDEHLSTVRSQRSENGSVIALNGLNCPQCEAAASILSHELLNSGETAVALVAQPCPKGRLEVKVLYNDLFLGDDSAKTMLQQLDDILAFILKHPAEPLESSAGAVHERLLSISNEGPQHGLGPDISPQYLHTQFESFAREEPDRIALDFRTCLSTDISNENTVWTYGQLDEKADILARHLLTQPYPLAGGIMPICMERRPELYVAVLGALKAGTAWCPIDPFFPIRRRHDLIARTGSKLLLVAGQDIASITQGIPRGVATIDISSLKEDGFSDRMEKLSAKIGNLAYLIWTSGTTGEPKGVPISHEAAVTSMISLQKSIPSDVVGGNVRCLQFSQFTFDVFVQDLFYTWGVGGTIISSTRGLILGSFAELATKTRATHCHLTPAFAASVPRERCPTLEVITMIGEKLTQAVADDWSKDMRAYNTYGPAEATVVSTLRRFGADGDEVQSGNIGFPLPSVSCFVMRDGHPLMRQGIGELALGGPQLSQGYWKDPERSMGRFVWNEHLSTHLYMTGDVVRQMYDGSLEFVGRTDDLIKIQGIRVELSEIGFALRSCHELVEQVEVQYLAREDRPSKAIVAFLAAPGLR